MFGSSSPPSWLRDSHNVSISITSVIFLLRVLSPASIILACAKLSVITDKRKKQASSEKASEQKRQGKRDGKAYKRLFKYLSPPTTLTTSRKTVPQAKMSKILCCK